MTTASSNLTCIQRERHSLLVFRQGLTDKSNRLSTWTGVECCEWQGVWCDRINGHVVKLDLRSPSSFMDYYISSNKSSWLKGKVSPSLLNLKRLRYLDLSMNNFLRQNIPEFFGSFKYLEYLNLSYSGFSGVVPPHLGNLSRLQYLDLNIQYRSDMVSLPYDVSLMVKDDLRWVSLLSSLKYLDFSGIRIDHTDWFHPVNMLPSLLTLNLASCHINIPSIKFINFTSLNSLDLSYNGINSAIPVWLSNLTGLVHLDLKDNNFHGQIPDSIGTLSSLSFIKLSYNQLSGPIPPSLGGLSSLRFITISFNQLSGSIPESIGQLSMLERLYFSSNQLSGSIPESIGQLSMLECLYLYENQLSGSIPGSIGQLSMLERLNLDGNQLNESIPESIGQLSMLERLYLDGNQLNESIPESIGRLSMLERLYLSNNQLSGSIPTSLGQLSNLTDLDVSGNSLDGVVFEIHFTKLKNLTYLGLSDNSITFNVSPHWIPPFQLKVFNASSCNIAPQFPNWLRTQTDLVVLHLSNSSIKDTIPEWFENISSHLWSLDLSENEIRGNLPRIITNNTGKSPRLNKEDDIISLGSSDTETKSSDEEQLEDASTDCRQTKSDTDSDFVEDSSSSHSKKKVKVTKVKINVKVREKTSKNNKQKKDTKKKKKEKGQKNQTSSDNLVSRQVPFQLVSVLSILNDMQKQQLRDIGFGTMVDFNIKYLPMKLAKMLVQRLDAENCQMMVDGKLLRITKPN